MFLSSVSHRTVVWPTVSVSNQRHHLFIRLPDQLCYMTPFFKHRSQIRCALLRGASKTQEAILPTRRNATTEIHRVTLSSAESKVSNFSLKPKYDT